MREIIVIAHNLRSCHNVGSLLRTAEGLGIQKVILSGYTPHPTHANDQRLPHESAKTTAAIHKTALGAETMVSWDYHKNILPVIAKLQKGGWRVAALEQAEDSVMLNEFHAPEKIVIILGREVEGLEPELLAACDTTLEIPMFGKKESFNVVQAAAIAMYHCRFF